jgi:hypothetical protein
MLGLGDFTYPLVGLALGVPAHRIPPKPRLPREAVVFENVYNDDDEARRAAIVEYENRLVGYPDPRPMTFSQRQNDQWGQFRPYNPTVANLKAKGWFQ